MIKLRSIQANPDLLSDSAIEVEFEMEMKIISSAEKLSRMEKD